MEDKTILYGSKGATCTNSVLAFLRVTGISYEFKEINIFAGEHKTEEYKKLNPFQKIPVLVDKGFVLRESMVLCRYLANSRSGAEQWYPKDARKRALVDLALEHWNQSAGKFFSIAAQAFGRAPDVTKEQAKETTDAAIKEFEEVFLKDNKFAAGDQPTLADLPYLYYLIGQSYYTGCNYDEHKRLNQWISDLYKAEPKLKDQATEYQEIVKVAFAHKN